MYGRFESWRNVFTYRRRCLSKYSVFRSREKNGMAYKQHKHSFPDRSTGDSRVAAGRVALHHPDTLLHSLPAIKVFALASTIFRPIPAGRPGDLLGNCSMRCARSVFQTRLYRFRPVTVPPASLQSCRTPLDSSIRCGTREVSSTQQTGRRCPH